MNSSIGIPEGFLVLAMLFIFPYLLARKNVFNLEEIIHSYMADTERIILPYIQKIYVIFFYRQRFNNIGDNR